MYLQFRNACERLLRIPPDPQAPPGDEASTRIFRAAPNFYKYLLLLWALRSVLSLGVALAILVGPLIGGALAGRKHPAVLLGAAGLGVFVIAVVAVFCIFSFAILRLNFEKRWYVVTDRSLRVREGVTTVREMTVNFVNIQNISISQGPIQRLLGIADLKVDTAGGGGGEKGRHGEQIGENLHTAWFRGISNASEIRELIQNRLKGVKDTGLGDAPAPGQIGEEVASGSSPLSHPALVQALREVHREAAGLRAVLQPNSNTGH